MTWSTDLLEGIRELFLDAQAVTHEQAKNAGWLRMSQHTARLRANDARQRTKPERRAKERAYKAKYRSSEKGRARRKEQAIRARARSVAAVKPSQIRTSQFPGTRAGSLIELDIRGL